jgi:hypothetical protein
MMRFEDIAFQLIDLPPLNEEHVEAVGVRHRAAGRSAVDRRHRGKRRRWLELTRRVLAAKGLDIEAVKRALVVTTGDRS